MKTLATIVTATVIAFPGLAAAMCDFHEQTVQVTCADGQVYDSETRACVPQTS